MTDPKDKAEEKADRNPIWFKEIACPACGAKVRTPRVKPSYLKVKSIDTDFHKRYELINPLLFAITTCQECNFSARNDDFDKQDLTYHPEIIQIANAIKASKKAVRFPETSDVSYEDSIKKYLLAITFYKHFKPENPNTIAGLYMHITWMYREQGNREKELEFMKQSLDYYIKTYEKGVHIPEKIGVVGIMYLIGEMYRILGDKTEALKWFSMTVKHEEIEAYPNIKNLTKDAWEKITEEKRNQNQQEQH